MIYRKYLKRLFDIMGSCVLLIILSPILLVIGVAVRIKLGTPVVFVQERPGYQEKIFKLYKFRSMKETNNREVWNIADEERLTPFGKKLRASSLDELPELVNILRGDMSFIGPRPLLVEYLFLYSEKHRHRHDVRPGLTGYAQVVGRNALAWEEKFDLDVEYVNNYSIVLDVRILLKTFVVLANRKGINSSSSATMEAFEGYNVESNKE